MASSAGRRDKRYLTAKALYQTGQFVCHVCNQRPGIEVDHVPPLSTALHWKLWTGELKPACPRCQRLEGGNISAGRTAQHPSRRW